MTSEQAKKRKGIGAGRVDSIVATGATVDNTDPANPTITVPAGGQVDSIIAGTNITVDATDPVNPIVAATGGGLPVLPYRSQAKYGLKSEGLLETNTGIGVGQINLFAGVLWIHTAVSFDQFTVRMESASGAGEVGRILLYDADPLTGNPGNLAYESTNFLLDSTSKQEIAISPTLDLPAGVYYGGMYGDGNVLSHRGVDFSTAGEPVHWPFADMGMEFDQHVLGVEIAGQTFGSPPDPWPVIDVNTDMLWSRAKRPAFQFRVA